MSDQIEKIGTAIGHRKYAKLPKQSLWSGPIHYGEANDDNDPNFIDKQAQVRVWLGFQKRSGIDLRRQKLRSNILDYHKNKRVAYIF